jgi:hypothetical protein
MFRGFPQSILVDKPNMVEAQGCWNTAGKTTEGKPWGESTEVKQLAGGKGLRRPVEVQPFMVESLRWQKIYFQSPGGQGTGYKARGAELQEQEAQGAGPNEVRILGKRLGGIAPGVK